MWDKFVANPTRRWCLLFYGFTCLGIASETPGVVTALHVRIIMAYPFAVILCSCMSERLCSFFYNIKALFLWKANSQQIQDSLNP